MKYTSAITIVAAFIALSGCKYLNIDAFSGSTLVWESGANNYFNQEPPSTLEGTLQITVEGELPETQTVKLKSLPWHSVTVREVVKESDTTKFLGTFRYDGYALSDILSSVKIDKKSKDDFYPPVDLYVEVWNDQGEYAVFSWGELFYSEDVYNVILAKAATRVTPGKTQEKWDLPTQMKIVCGSDLYAERNISNPVKIVIKSLQGKFVVNRDPEKFYSEELNLIKADTIVAKLTSVPKELPVITRKTIYYGHGMGYKGMREFSGVMLDKILSDHYPSDKHSLRTGLVCVEGVDGYRASFSLSEILNRIDGMEPLLMFGSSGEKGRESFSLYATGDMFADRSVKGLNKITLY